MATRFVRVDLAEDAVDFRPIAIEPGVPLLDTAGANDKIMFKWLGGLIAEPEWQEDGHSVNFYVRDEQGGRLEEATVQLVEEGDLEGPLAGQVEQIRERLNAAKAYSGAEDMMLRLVKSLFNEIIENPDYPGRLAFFYKYKDANDNVRLVWAYGYQRSDEEIGKPIICDDPECMQLYVQRPNTPKRCPGCQAMPWTRKKRMDAMKRRAKRTILLLLLLLLLGWMLFNTLFALKVTPKPVIVPVGATVDFKVAKPGMFNLGLILAGDVSSQAQTQVADTRVMYFTDGLKAFAQSPGKTQITFFAARRKKTIDVEVVPPVMPSKVRIEPEKAELAVGSTVQFKVIGEYEDGTSADLSQACVWKSKNDNTIYHYNGFVEGLSEGSSTVVCQYRASAKDQYIDASAEVTVTPEAFQTLKVSVTPQNIPLGMDGKVSVTAQTASGKTVDMTGSSQLDWSIDPPQAAQYKGAIIKTLNPGGGAIKLRLGELSADCPFSVVEGSGKGGLRVSPTELSMHVDELLPLSISGASGSPVKVVSRNLKVVGIDDQGRLIGRSAGTADVVVKAGGEEKTVKVSVLEGKVASIAAFPPEIAVPVDHAVPAKILALSANGTYFSLAPERVTVDTKPSTKYAEVDNRLMIKGYESASSQPLILNYRGTTANAPVSVIPAPQRLKITPEGQVKLPLGLCMSFDGWATYGDGVVARVPYTRIAWQNEPTETEGFAFKGGKAMALKPGVGPIAIWGSYYGSTSNRVELTTDERADVTLKLDVDRNIRVQGESGRAILTGYSPTLGDVELVPDIAEYKSSDDKILKPNNPKSDVYMAILPGKAALSAKHIAADKPAAVDLSVVAGRDATLRWEKDSVKLAVDQAVENKLYLDAKLGEDDTITSVEMTTGAQYKIERPDAVYWQAPVLFGQSSAEPFKMTASYIPYVKGSAECTVEVAEAAVPAEIKIVPQYVTTNPAPGSAVALAVEELLSGDSEFKEVEPSAIAWDVPSGVYWNPPGVGTRPEVIFPDNAAGAYTIQARYAGKAASLTLTADKSTLDPNDPEVEIFVKRYPPGIFVPVDSSQGYAIVLKKGDREEMATNVQWGPNFESEFVEWTAPVLKALKPNYLHWMEAKVGNRSVRWYAQTCDLYAEGMKREAEPGQPTSVQLLCDQGDEVNVPVGAKFTDFRVIAKFGKRTKLVTAKATFYATGDKKSSTPNNGAIEALAPGSATYTAEYMGVESDEKIKVNVVADLDIDSMKLIPDKEIRLLTNNGELATFDAEGFKNGKSIGLITSFPDLKWESSDPNVATMQANKALGKEVGKANVTASINNVTSSPAVVEVVATIQEQFGPVESVVNMRVGESRVLGKDVAIVRGNTDFSKMCTVVSGNPACVEYNAAMNAIVGKAPGISVVTFLMGDKKATITAIVKGLTAEELKDIQENGEILIEPAAATISVGQALEPRVYVVTPSGLKLDRTASAVFMSKEKECAEVRGFQVCGLQPGTSTISATLPEMMVKKVRGNCELTVDNNPITEIVVEPAALQMSVGDTRNLFIQGKSAAGLYPMFAQADLKVTTDSPAAVMQGIRTVSAAQEGQANVNVAYKTAAASVPVTVTNDPFENLSIDPPAPTIAVGESMRFQVTAMRGGRLHVVTEADGLRFYTADPKVAAASKDCAVLGVSEGRTVAVAELGALKTDASVTVVPPGINGGVINNIETGGVGYGSTYVGDAPGLVDIVEGEYIVGADGNRLAIGEYIDEHGVLVNNGLDLVNEVGAVRTGELVGLKFMPDMARIAGVGASQPVQVYEYYSDGSLGRDVTADPALQLTTPKNADWTPAAGGGKLLVGKALGNGQAEATLGTLGTISPLAVQVGGMTENTGVLVVQPQQMSLVQGESRTLDAVQIVPDSGLLPFDISYRISALDNSGVIQVDPNTNTITGLQPGAAQVKVETVDPNGMNDKRVAFVRVDVSTPPNYTITPPDVVLQIGQSTPSFTVSSIDPTTGQAFPAPATFTADDPSILAQDPADPSRFIARSMGSTQVQAMVNGRSAGFAKVSVSGQRFLSVEQTGDPNTTPEGFTMTMTATGAGSAGNLEYRVYMEGQPGGAWVPAQPNGEMQVATLVTPILPHKPLGSQYTLIIEARTAGGTDIQQYPFNFRTGMNIQRLNQ